MTAGGLPFPVPGARNPLYLDFSGPVSDARGVQVPLGVVLLPPA